MKSITEQTGHERDRLREVVEHLRSTTEGMSYSELFDNFDKSIYRGRYTFSGKVSDALVERLGRLPTMDEIIILVDRGFSHFGAEGILDGRSFSGRVNTD